MPSASVTVRACAIDLGRGLRNDAYAGGGNLVIGELLHRQFAQTRDHFIAEGAGGKHLIWLDQCHLQFWIKLPQRPRATRTAKTAADHDNARRALRNNGRGNAEAAAAEAMPRATSRRVTFMR